jgi:hypothetical protein
MSRVLDNLINVIKTLRPNNATPFDYHVLHTITEADNLRCYLLDEILKGSQ